jgi:hypothetical protein
MHDEIRVNAVLDRHWSAWFNGLDVSSDEHGRATIAGPVSSTRQPARPAGKVRDLGLELLAVGCTDPC